ncbi:LUD domain-containing protein [Microbacterium atlanticum]|uniref:LUD domain-containing protein n=1 Tax=Microbacterium atlanticum TaxID=2782168 RepID=UPI0018895AF3|nr:LUD domain-containing protein [Microbacterium atlanticum]
MTTDSKTRFTLIPDTATIDATRTALESRGFSVEVTDTLDEARHAALARIPEGASVMTHTSVTVDQAGISAAIDEGHYGSARTALAALDWETQRDEQKAVVAKAQVALGSVHAVTEDGILMIASASGSQLGAYLYTAEQVIFVVGVQKIVPDLATAHERVYQHTLPLEDIRARAAYGVPSSVNKILEIRQERPGRIHVVLVRQNVGY